MNDLYAETTARIVAALERGSAPWVRPWSTLAEAIPMNAQSKRQYRGVNFTLLTLEAEAHGYPVNRWLTYRQAAELGGQVRRGERGTTVVFWKLKKLAAEVFPDSAAPDLPDRVYPLLRAYTVFNVAQVDGLAPELTHVAAATWEPEARAEELLLKSGAQLRFGGSKAFYRPGSDEIQLPPQRAFPTAGGYYNVALHELTHWTSHESRCNRQLGKRFGDDAYASEELIAEMGAAFLCAHCRIDGELRHAAYLDSWLRVLRTDKRAIFIAAAKAQQAADYLLARLQPGVTEALAA
jgi:antirestriction protein ArdC